LLGLLASCGAGSVPDVNCGFADGYLPDEVGGNWTYRVTDPSAGARSTKFQRLEATDAHPEYGDVVLQITEKDNGRTESLLGRDGDRLIRFEQKDYDLAGALERTTIYDPGFLRLDESPEHLETGVTFTEQYTATEIEPTGTTMVARTEQWEVLGVDVACSSPMGEFSCLHVRRQRVAGGAADKQFYFARGVGKVRETGSDAIEELTACAGAP
jgi:hypothetical protein